jgi:hypothetical protein
MLSQLFSTHKAPGALLLVAVAVLALPACSKSKKPAGAKPSPTAAARPSASPTKPPTIQADFHPDSVAAVDAQDRPSSNNVAIDASKKVIDLINSYYNIAFIDPSKWDGGLHPDLPSLFSDDAKTSVAPNLQALALDALAGVLSKVQPNVQKAAAIRVLVEPNQTASYAAVTTHFDATGTHVAAGAQPVHIIHDFQILVDIGANKIVAYEVSTSADSVAKSASYLPPSLPALAALGAR